MASYGHLASTRVIGPMSLVFDILESVLQFSVSMSNSTNAGPSNDSIQNLDLLEKGFHYISIIYGDPVPK